MRLPPLNALRAFEAAARHQSVQKAAQELHVTPAAVSQQVKLLEERLGVALFRRLPRRLALTEEGLALLPKLSKVFVDLAAAVEQVEARKTERRNRVLIGVPQAFGSNWLLPRLQQFQDTQPDIELRLSARSTMSDEVRKVSDHPGDVLEGNDIAIRFGDGYYPGCVVERLFVLHSTPMCSPALIDGQHPLVAPEDLRRHTLLHIQNDVAMMDVGWPKWADWMKAAGVADVNTSRGPVFNQVTLAIEAAADRMGVVLGVPLLAAELLNSGRLTVPFPLSLTMSSSYYVVHGPENTLTDEVRSFRDWLLGEASRECWAQPIGGLQPMRWIP